MGAIIATLASVFVTIISARPSDIIFWYKWILSYIYIRNTKKPTHERFSKDDVNADHDPLKTDFLSSPEDVALELPLEESDLYTNADGVFCYGVNSKSECLVVRIARSCNNEAEAWVYLKLANGKVYQLKETSGYQQSSSEKKTFSCGGLQMQYLLPMRIWRIFYNGLLSETNENGPTSNKMVHVKFGLIWRASSDVFDFATDISDNAFAQGLANAKWKGLKPPIEEFNRIGNSYVQCGTISGTINIEDNEEDYSIYLFGERMRLLGDMLLVKKMNFINLLGHNPRTGNFIHLAQTSIENVVENLSFGFVTKPVGEMCFVTDTNFVIEENRSENDVLAKFHIGEKSYDLKGKLVGESTSFLSKKILDGPFTANCVNFQLNGEECAGILIKGSIMKSMERPVPPSLVYKTPAIVPLVVQFSEKPCQDSAITGGKGSSLGKLTELSKDFQNFIVPNGVVVTTSAYQKFLTKDVITEIKKVEDVLYGNIEGDVKEACQRVIDEILRSEIPEQLQENIVNKLQQAFPEKDTLQFAVRSSATGEDTEQMSAAGQMETFLGVKGVDEILFAIKKCWASQFSHIAVQYKKQYGQIINSPMAVVIQKMIPCDLAGVLFTCDPLNGNPTILSITANYGLGESVVSASEEPDALELKRDSDDKLSIQKKIIGAKSRRIVLQDEKGTNVEEISEDQRKSCCLTDEMALRLGNLAVQIEKSYRSHRDIEWGFWNNNLYIFQSRPVTSGSGETDFEIDHETDAPLRVENEYYTMCNVGEVMPGALSPLGLDIISKYFRVAFKRRAKSSWQSDFKPRYFPRGITSMYNHVMFYCIDLLERMDENKNRSQAALVALFGRIIEDEELFRVAKERFEKTKKPLFFGSRQFLIIISRLYQSPGVLQEALQTFSDYRIHIDKCETSHELFATLLHSCTDLHVPMASHMMNSETSTIWNIFIFNIIKEARGGELSSEVYRDFAALITTSSDVESADVPAGIDRLAFAIRKERSADEIKKMEIKEIQEWLEKSSSEAGQKYREFLTRHGHRCLREFDVRSKTWGTDPATLIQLLRNLAGTPSRNSESKVDKNTDTILSNLGLSIGYKTRLLLKFLIPQSRRAVQNREKSKSLLVKSQDQWRKGYRQLAKLMVSEGRIPDEDLLYFMHLDEIKELLETRSPKIISKANHRRRRYPVLDKYIFPEIMKGFPIPVNMEDNSYVSSDENFSMTGIPVSQGVAKAYVRVALTLEEAAHLQPGEILLTYSTDIGWSPYFPMLAGVVTELGGLISHGAVVSREYGLPCIAGLHGATRQFQTGDYVLLDGNKGFLQRLPKPQNPEATS